MLQLPRAGPSCGWFPAAISRTSRRAATGPSGFSVRSRRSCVSALGAEIYENSVILGETAYEVEIGSWPSLRQRHAGRGGGGCNLPSLEDPRVSPDRVVIGTRGSALALWQADHVAALLHAAHPGLVVERSIIVTTGDRTPQGPLWEAGGKAVWVKESRRPCSRGEVDLAVHSLKDVPAELAPGLCWLRSRPRADVRDALVSRDGATLAALPADARLGTTSLRRICQVKALRPDLRLVPLRATSTRGCARWPTGRWTRPSLACAGLDRLGLSHHIAERIPVERMLPCHRPGSPRSRSPVRGRAHTRPLSRAGE